MSNVKFSLFIKKAKKNTQNQHPIVLTISVAGVRSQIYTGVSVESKLWNPTTKKIKGYDDNSKALNSTLEALLINARKISNQLIISGVPFNPNTIKEQLRSGGKKNPLLIEQFDKFLLRMNSLIPIRYTRSTLVKYTNTKNRVKEFIKHKTNRNDIFLYELNTQFMEEFDLWLRKKYKVESNTVYKSYQRLTRFIRYEISIGNLEKYPFVDYKIKMVVKPGHYLSFDDIRKLENLRLELPRLEQTRLIFLFCCYVGTSFIDTYNLTINNLIKEENGILWIKSYRQKSRARVSVPLISNAIRVLEELRSGKYQIQNNKLLPIKSNVHLNLEIKQVCEFAGIKNPEKVTWHSARRSTSSLLMKAGLPITVLQKVLSHKSLSTSIDYYSHTDDEMVAKAMNELDIKINTIDNFTPQTNGLNEGFQLNGSE